MTCKDCLHYELCRYNTFQEAHYFGKDKEIYITIDNNSPCKYFADRSKWKYAEYKVGDTVWYVDGLYDNAVIRPAIVEYIDIVDKNDKMWLGACVDGDIHIEKEIECFYHTREEAEKALEEKK